jgi:hypothetical protein
MEKSGLVNSIIDGVVQIANGRRGVQKDGEEREGRISFELGHALVREAFAAALETRDVEMIILAEYIYTAQELTESTDAEPHGRSSAQAAIDQLDDAFLALKAVEEGPAYHIADLTFPHRAPFRYKNMPKDSFHLACISDRTRIHNGLTRLGIPALDIGLAHERMDALTAAQAIYLEKQTAAIAANDTITEPAV